MKRVNELVPAIEATTARLLDAVAAGAEFDLVATLAFPLPASIVFSLIGVPDADFVQLKRWCGYRAALGWGRPAPQDQVEIATHMAAYRKYLRELVDRKRAAAGGRPDRRSARDRRRGAGAAHARRDRARSCSRSFAGHETTTGLIGNTVRRLLEAPQRWNAIAGQPALIPAASRRRCGSTRRFRCGGGSPRARSPSRASTCRAGARLFLWLAAAGRDEEAFDRPGDFDMSRTDAGQHLAFGKGLHYCLGANLGKLEVQIAVTELARRFPALRLVPDQRLTFHPNISFRGPQVLMVRTGR